MLTSSNSKWFIITGIVYSTAAAAAVYDLWCVFILVVENAPDALWL